MIGRDNFMVNIIQNNFSTSTSQLDFREMLLKVMNNYLNSKREEFKNHPLGEFVRGAVKNIIATEAGLNSDRYLVAGSVGQGQWAEIPWISIYLRNLTVSATRGYYIVYLFTANMDGVYISLNQGWTYFREKYGTKLGRKKIKKTASLIRESLHTVSHRLQETEIYLKGKGELAIGYEHGHIYGRYYSFDSLPESKELLQDLHDLLIVYNEIEKLIGERTIEQFNDYLLLEDDGSFIESGEKEESYQESVQNTLVSQEEIDGEEVEEEKPRKRPEPVIDKSGRKRWPRNANTAAKALRLSKYKCAFNENHTTFISKATGKPYMELHHLVPMKYQDKFEYDLDRVAAILSLCPTCHRRIHHGTDQEKEEMLHVLFNKRRKQLESIGINVSFEELKKMYDINS
jgi:5-methylcytosine-specific restriction enzyme A